MSRNLTALEAALDKVSPDGDSYTNGWNAYHHVMDSDPETDQDIKEDKAIHYAIGVAAPVLDFETWWAAYRTYYDTPQDKKPTIGDKARQRLASAKQSKSSSDDPSGESKPWWKLI